jgi:hypothetical protein
MRRGADLRSRSPATLAFHPCWSAALTSSATAERARAGSEDEQTGPGSADSADTDRDALSAVRGILVGVRIGIAMWAAAIGGLIHQLSAD